MFGQCPAGGPDQPERRAQDSAALCDRTLSDLESKFQTELDLTRARGSIGTPYFGG